MTNAAPPDAGAPLDPHYAPPRDLRVRRHADRATDERARIHAVLDEALVAHLAQAREGRVLAMPMAFVRLDETIYVHGARANATLDRPVSGDPFTLTVTLLDGLVLAKSQHSMNYRSVVVAGVARDVRDEAEQRRAHAALVDKLEPGRSARARPPSDRELASTRLVAIAIEHAVMKQRSGPPSDVEEDRDWPCEARVATFVRAVVG